MTTKCTIWQWHKFWTGVFIKKSLPSYSVNNTCAAIMWPCATKDKTEPKSEPATAQASSHEEPVTTKLNPGYRNRRTMPTNHNLFFFSGTPNSRGKQKVIVSKELRRSSTICWIYTCSTTYIDVYVIEKYQTFKTVTSNKLNA